MRWRYHKKGLQRMRKEVRCSSLPQRPPMPKGPSSSGQPTFHQSSPLPPQDPMTSAPLVPLTIVTHDATLVLFCVLVQGGNGTRSNGYTVPLRMDPWGWRRTFLSTSKTQCMAMQVEKLSKNGRNLDYFQGYKNQKRQTNGWLLPRDWKYGWPIEIWVRIALGAFKDKARTSWDFIGRVH